MGVNPWKLACISLVIASVALVFCPAPAQADTVSIGSLVSFDIDYPPLDPSNPGDTPTLSNVVLYAQHSFSGGGEFSDVDWAGRTNCFRSFPAVRPKP